MANRLAGMGDLSTDRRQQAKSHGSEPGRGRKRAGMAGANALGRPHLMLAYVRRYHRVRWQHCKEPIKHERCRKRLLDDSIRG